MQVKGEQSVRLKIAGIFKQLCIVNNSVPSLSRTLEWLAESKKQERSGILLPKMLDERSSKVRMPNKIVLVLCVIVTVKKIFNAQNFVCLWSVEVFVAVL
jgi:hypothetical protein